MKLAVIIVSYNTRDLLRQALASVAASARVSGLDGDDVTIVVVDNASADGSAAMVAGEFPDVRLIAAAENLGFTRANNLALAELGFAVSPAVDCPSDRPDYVLLLNPDAELVDDALGRMVRFLDAHPAVGACGPRLEYGDGSFQHGAFAFPGLGQVALDLFPAGRASGRTRALWRRRQRPLSVVAWEGETPFEVDFVLGAAMMMRGAAIERIGGLDEGFFMYCEEMDWCLRLAQAGIGRLRRAGRAGDAPRRRKAAGRRRGPPSASCGEAVSASMTNTGAAFRPATCSCVRILLRTAMRLRRPAGAATLRAGTNLRASETAKSWPRMPYVAWL